MELIEAVQKLVDGNLITKEAAYDMISALIKEKKPIKPIKSTKPVTEKRLSKQEEEDQYIRENYKKIPTKKIAAKFNKPEQAIRDRARKIGLSKKRGEYGLKKENKFHPGYG